MKTKLKAAPKSIKIGKQIWTTENLNVACFNNGDPIPEAKSAKEWKKAGDEHKPAWCYYENKIINQKKFGRLYNWFAITDKRRIAPEGWHIPSAKEWSLLVKTLGGKVEAGWKMKSASGWVNGSSGTDTLGFSARPAGYREYDGAFGNVYSYSPGKYTFFWSTTKESSISIWTWELTSNYTEITKIGKGDSCGFSVRCIKD